jgi:GTP-binding protein HflX
VGYTNSGKSTLFNRLTKAEVLAEDMLFATLDPTMRAVELDGGRRIILSDTVGFISELPTTLVAAFRATLEEVCEADLIVHVRDASHPDSNIQKLDVEAVLKELGVELTEEGEGTPFIEALNKIDLMPEEERDALITLDGRQDRVVAISGLTGDGCDRLLEAIDLTLSRADMLLKVDVPYNDGATPAWLHANSRIVVEKHGDSAIHYEVYVDPVAWAKYKSRQRS